MVPFQASLTAILREPDIVSFPTTKRGFNAECSHLLELKHVAGSLTLGGYDASRFVPHDITFPFAGDVSRDLVVGLLDIAIRGPMPNTSLMSLPKSLLPQSILSFIDPGVSHIWLPGPACDLFAETLGLQYDPLTNLYLVNETTHESLIQQNVTIAFRIATDTSASESTRAVTIDFPYSAFDLELTADYPGINKTTRYFPIRRAANDTQYTLGRTFLQQAYIIADYERSNFSVYPCIFSENAKQDLRSIHPIFNTSTLTNGTDNSKEKSKAGHSFLPGIIAAIVIGSIVIVLLVSCGAFLLGRRRDSLEGYKLRLKRLKQKHARSSIQRSSEKSNEPPKLHSEMEGDVLHRGELGGDLQFPSELPAGLGRPEELSADTCRTLNLESLHAVGCESQEDVVRHGLAAETIYSYVQTPVSKVANADQKLCF